MKLLIKSLFLSCFVLSTTSCGTDEDKILSSIFNQIQLIDGVDSVGYHGQYSQGGRGPSVCALLITTKSSREEYVKGKVKIIEQQYKGNYSFCVNRTTP